jgi:hypothetical protein
LFVLVLVWWCDVVFDGERKGQYPKVKRFSVPAGKRRVECNNGKNDFAATVELRPGRSKTVTGSVLPPITLTIAASAEVRIDSRSYRTGQTVTLKRGTYRVESVATGQVKHLQVVKDCTLRDSPQLSCN